MFRKLIAPTLVLALLAGCAGAPPPGDTSAADRATIDRATDKGTAIVDEQGEKLICRREAKVGSRLARDTVCMTQAEWTRVSEESQRETAKAITAVKPKQGT